MNELINLDTNKKTTKRSITWLIKFEQLRKMPVRMEYDILYINATRELDYWYYECMLLMYLQAFINRRHIVSILHENVKTYGTYGFLMVSQ